MISCNLRGVFFIRVLAFLSAITLSVGAKAGKEPVFTGWGRFAIQGYDTVAYHLERKPVKGSRDFSAQWNGVTWLFKNSENRDRFIAKPERWAPRYGGYCAWAIANNYTASTSPGAWSIVDGRLYLNYSLGVRDTWSKDIPGNIRRANSNWPQALAP